MLPISYDGVAITVAVSTENVELVDRIRQLTRKDVRTVLLPIREIRENLKALYPAVLDHYARHYKTGLPMPAELTAKIRKAETFNQGYKVTEVVAAAELDMQWHILPASAPLQSPDTFEKGALEKMHLLLSAVPPRYRSSYFRHIWDVGQDYSAGYYAYLWAEMLDDDAYQYFEDNGGLTRANGDRFRQMVLSRGNTENLAKMYAAWRGKDPSVEPMMKYRGLQESAQ